MSYDIDLFLSNNLESPLEQAQKLNYGWKKIRPSIKADNIRKKLVDDLLKLHPKLKVVNDRKGFSYGCWVGNHEIDCGVPNIEIGIKTAFLSISYSANSEKGFKGLQRTIEIFEEHGFYAYDPQLDQLITSKDLEQSISSFENTGEMVQKFLHKQGEEIL